VKAPVTEVDLGAYLARWDGRQWAVGRKRPSDPSKIERPRYFGSTTYTKATERLRTWAQDRARLDAGLVLPPHWQRDSETDLDAGPDLFSQPSEEAEKERVLGDLAELRADYLERIREEVRRRAEMGMRVTPDDARDYFESLNPPPPEELSRNFLAAVFRTREWEVVGTYKSTTPGSHANRLNEYGLRSNSAEAA